MTLLETFGAISIVFGCVFALTGSVGVLRMPDFYSRLHPAGKSDTLAQGLILFGLALFAGEQLIEVLGADHGAHGGEHHGPPAWLGPLGVMIKLMLLAGLLFLTAPTATHAIAKAARLDKHTKIKIDGDPDNASQSRVAEIVVMGDTHQQLDEAPDQVLDVLDGEDTPADAPEPADESDPADTPSTSADSDKAAADADDADEDPEP